MSDDIYRCDECEMRFRSRELYTAHRQVTGHAGYRCSCGEAFTSVGAWQAHTCLTSHIPGGPMTHETAQSDTPPLTMYDQTVDGTSYIIAIESLGIPGTDGTASLVTRAFLKSKSVWWKRRSTLKQQLGPGVGGVGNDPKELVQDFLDHEAEWEVATYDEASTLQLHHKRLLVEAFGQTSTGEPVVGSIVQVTWAGVKTQDDWNSAEDARVFLERQAPLGVVVGFVVAQNDDALVLATGKMDDDTSFRLLTRIPRSSVVRLEVLVR